MIPILEFDNPIFHPGRNTTIRRGDRWHPVPQVRLRLRDGSLSPPTALETALKTFSDLSQSDIAFEHDPKCRSLAGLLREMQRIYPGFDPGEDITVCHFNV
ncbi:hypothetical protein H5368_05335 [Luteimonas sp. MC1782]|uniref:hypothetical protein n=1 Tax=Luteimonas sp. MC1782 TaxID=2760305 RepID=UPI0016017EDC|nr:hypothetical protein [Luteimonas sp. MC1782]MBB1472446.1 hypothetical protein [Luteimonas sp. MC1782]